MKENIFIGICNDLALESDGWAQLAPFGDFPGVAMIAMPNGDVKRMTAVQRIDRLSAENLVSQFKSPLGRVARWLRGCPIYIGHPDVTVIANQYEDKESKGIISDLEVRDDGLWCKPVFTNEGADLVDKKLYRAFSGYWTAVPDGEEGGNVIMRPAKLKSAGLTNHPNLPVHILNEQQNEIMKKEQILEWLKKRGITLANDATDEQITAALDKVGETIDTLTTEKAKAETSLANEQQTVTAKAGQITALTTERDKAQADFANERKARIGLMLDNAIADGRISPPQKDAWAAKLEADFANECTKLNDLKPSFKTQASTDALGQRKGEADNSARNAQQELISMANERMRTKSEDWDTAWATVKRENPKLFESMNQKAAA